MAELVREDSDVDTFGRANEAEHRIREEAVPPAVVGAVPDENLRDAILTRKIDDCRYGVVAFQHFGSGSCFFRGVEIFSNRGPLSFRPAGLAHIHRVQVALKTLFVAFAAFDHGQCIGMRRHADEKTLLGPKDKLDSVRLYI